MRQAQPKEQHYMLSEKEGRGQGGCNPTSDVTLLNKNGRSCKVGEAMQMTPER